MTRTHQQQKRRQLCSFHYRDGHGLQECKTFTAKALEKTEWILQAGPCHRCLSEDHRAKNCKQTIQCSVCKENRHDALLHKQKQRKPEGGASVYSKCTPLCGGCWGDVSYRKLVRREKPESICRAYASFDDQSNKSLITSELEDELGETSPLVRYYLTTSSGEKEAKYGRRVTNVVLKSLNGSESELPTLIKCNNISRNNQEITTPERRGGSLTLMITLPKSHSLVKMPTFIFLSDQIPQSCLK